MVKKSLLLGLLGLLIILIGCATEDFPPEPGKPGTVGGRSFAGKAVDGGYAGADAYAEPPLSFSIDQDSFQFKNTENSEALYVELQEEGFLDYVYITGYTVGCSGSWREFAFEGERVGESNWLRGDAFATINVDLNDFCLGQENYVVAYACSKNTKEDPWNCHGDKWMLHQFGIGIELEEQGCTTAADCPANNDCVYGQCIALPGGPGGPGVLPTQ